MRPPPAGRTLAPLPRYQDAQSGRGPDRSAQHRTIHHHNSASTTHEFISTANKEKNMAVIEETPDVTVAFRPVRTGVAVMVAGVATGTVLYVLSVVVAGWA